MLSKNQKIIFKNLVEILNECMEEDERSSILNGIEKHFQKTLDMLQDNKYTDLFHDSYYRVKSEDLYKIVMMINLQLILETRMEHGNEI